MGHASQLGAHGIYEAVPRKPGVVMVFLVPLLGIIVATAASILAAVIYTALHRPADGAGLSDGGWRESAGDMINDPGGLIWLALSSQLGFLIVTLCAAWLSPMGIARRLRLRPSTMPWVGYLTLPVGMLSLNLLFQSVVRLFPTPKGGTLDVLHNAFTHLTPDLLFAAIMAIGIMPGVAEEFLFRGYVQSRLAIRWGRWVAIPIAAFMFGLAHFDVVQSTATFFMGLYLGYVAERSGSIRPSMFAHMFNNSIVLLGSWMAGRGASGAEAKMDNLSLSATLIQALICAVILTLCCIYVRYRVHPPAIEEPIPSERLASLISPAMFP
jgi:membrane protease YdiL (CAAX protease family)